jgi:hypothetical protein
MYFIYHFFRRRKHLFLGLVSLIGTAAYDCFCVDIVLIIILRHFNKEFLQISMFVFYGRIEIITVDNYNLIIKFVLMSLNIHMLLQKIDHNF